MSTFSSGLIIQASEVAKPSSAGVDRLRLSALFLSFVPDRRAKNTCLWQKEVGASHQNKLFWSATNASSVSKEYSVKK